MRTTAVSLLPIAVMAPGAVFAQADASGIVTCNGNGIVRTIEVAAKASGSGCEVRYDSGDGAGQRVLWSANNSMSYCEDQADGLAAKLTNAGYNCGATTVQTAAAAPVAQAAPAAPAATVSTTTVASAAPAASNSGQGDFGFDAGEAVEEPKPVFVNEIEIGAGWVSDDSAEFGEFSGHQTQGAFLLGNISVQMRSPYDGDSTEYFVVRGTDLGIESRSVYAEYGKQGKFGIFGLFDSVPKYLHDDARTPYIISDGGTMMTLPAGWVASNRDISALTELNASLQDINVSHQREKGGGGLFWLPAEHLKFKTSFTRETKQGARTIAAIFGSSGGNPAGAIVPEPIDYETDNFDASLAYTGKKAQFAFNYNLSVFRDNNDALTFQNPFNSASWAAAPGFPDGFGSLATPPDSEAHSFSFAGRYLLTNKTNATAHVTYSRMTQDDAFLPYTINPGLVVSVLPPRDSLDGEINAFTADLGISTQVTPKLSYRVSYRYENRDNNTPQDLYFVLRGDVENQNTDISGSRARFNLPYSREQQRVQADINYNLSSGTRLSAGYEYEQFERDFTERRTSREHKAHAKIASRFSQTASGWVGVNYSTRGGSEYIGNVPFVASRTPERVGPDPSSAFENHPLVRKFYIANRDQIRVDGAVTWTLGNDFIISAAGRYSKDDYNETILGLKENTTANLTGDVSYQPSEKLNYHVFYTYDDVDYEQAGLSYDGGATPAQLVDFAATGWSADTQDRVHTAGAGMEWDVVKDKFNLAVDYYFSHASTDIVFDGGTALTFGPAPDLETRLHSIETVAEYQATDHMWFKFRYTYSNYSVTDFALDGVNPDTMRTIIGLGNQAPDFNVHVIGFSGVYRF